MEEEKRIDVEAEVIDKEKPARKKKRSVAAGREDKGARTSELGLTMWTPKTVGKYKSIYVDVKPSVDISSFVTALVRSLKPLGVVTVGKSFLSGELEDDIERQLEFTGENSDGEKCYKKA